MKRSNNKNCAESKRNEKVTAAEERIEAKLGDLTEGPEGSGKKRRLAPL